MAIYVNDNYSPLAPKILDNRYGPYTSTTEANLAIDIAYRVVGLTVGVLSGSTSFEGGRFVQSSQGIIEYWYLTGITDSDLVEKAKYVPQGEPNFVDKEVLSPVNGVNNVYVLLYTPEVGSVDIFYNGLLQKEGFDEDYTISGRVITFNTPPISGSKLLASYRTYSEINFIDNETPSGLIDGINTLFELSVTPVPGSEHLYLNGLLQDSGMDLDYTITGRFINFNIAPPIDSIILCSYRGN
jgi:hypothetical protein